MSLRNPALEGLLKKKLENAPAIKAADGKDIVLPTVSAPSLDDLIVDVSLPAELDEEAFADEMWMVLREHAVVTDRAPGAVVEDGDEVLVDLVGYADGAVVPNTAYRGYWLTAQTSQDLPGMRDALVGSRVGQSKSVEVVYDETHPREDLWGTRVVYAVDIQGARDVRFPDPEDPAFLEAMGAKDIRELSEAVAAKLAEEVREYGRAEGERLILEELGDRLDVEIDDAVIDAEITRRVNLADGATLRAKGLGIDDQEAVLNAWLSDDELRDEIAAAYRTSLALGAIAIEHKLEPTQEDFEAFVEAAASAAGATVDEMKASWRESPALHADLESLLRRTKAIDFVLAHAEVNLIVESAES